ncbi:MAG TPA: hypothetical protein GYA08_22975 [Chloroflexi bacterium]|nr:hypothetical protein [Chloroflexota bacterium]
MNTQNVTLAIPKDVLHKARKIAVDRQTSLSSMMTQALLDLVSYGGVRVMNPFTARV